MTGRQRHAHLGFVLTLVDHLFFPFNFSSSRGLILFSRVQSELIFYYFTACKVDAKERKKDEARGQRRRRPDLSTQTYERKLWQSSSPTLFAIYSILPYQNILHDFTFPPFLYTTPFLGANTSSSSERAVGITPVYLTSTTALSGWSSGPRARNTASSASLRQRCLPPFSSSSSPRKSLPV